MKRLTFGNVIRYSLLVIVVLVIIFGMNVTPASAEVVAKFSPGGTQVTISSSPSDLLRAILITYCDGTTGGFGAQPIRGLYKDFTYIDDKPMEVIEVHTTGFGHAADGIPGTITRFKRECDNPKPSDLSCRVFEFPAEVKRNSFPFVVFRAQKTMIDAFLKFPGYEYVLISQRYIWNSSLRTDLTLEFILGTGLWQGNIPAMFLPVGDHKDVVLIVRDEFGQQGKCRVGDLTVLP